MSDDGWLPVMKDSALRARSVAAVFPKGLPVLLVRLEGGEVRAVANRCPHMGCPLARGRLDGPILTCPCHDWRFDVRTGEFLDAPEIKLRVYERELRNGEIFIKL